MTTALTTPRRRQSKEHSEQTRFVMKVRAFHPEVLCAAIPNGAAVTAAQRLRLTHEGMMPGFPDLVLFAAGLAPLAIEMKTDTGKTSKEQTHCHDALRDRGVAVHVCRSCEEAYSTMLKWLETSTNNQRRIFE